MPKGQRFEHVELRVRDLEGTAAFYRDVVGMSEVARADGVLYLGFGLDENYDVALVEGEPGLLHFAIRLDNDDEVARYERRLREAGIESERRDEAEPNQEAAVRFRL